MFDRNLHKGFGLIEIMVGLLIGMISTIVIFQVFALNERQKRTITGSSDAQSNGALALYMVERDVKNAGFGIEASFLSNCTNLYTYYEDDSGAIVSIEDFFAPPVTLIDGGGNASDTIELRYYANPGDGQFSVPNNTTLRSTMPQSSAELNVNNTQGCEEGSLAIAQQAGSCTLMQITHVQEQALKLQHNPGGSPSYNPAANYQNANNWPAYTTGAALRCMAGPDSLSRRVYLVSANQSLERQENSDPIEEVIPHIVNIQAEFGIADAGGGQTVNNWTPATGDWQKSALIADKDNSKRIKAIRVAIVARSSEYEKPENGGVCSSTTDAMISGWSAWADLSAIKNIPDWQCYRFKTYETVIPLRNVIWADI